VLVELSTRYTTADIVLEIGSTRETVEFIKLFTIIAMYALLVTYNDVHHVQKSATPLLRTHLIQFVVYGF